MGIGFFCNHPITFPSSAYRVFPFEPELRCQPRLEFDEVVHHKSVVRPKNKSREGVSKAGTTEAGVADHVWSLEEVVALLG